MPPAGAPTTDAPGPGDRIGRARLAQHLGLAAAVIGVLSQATSIIDWVTGTFDNPPAAVVAPRIVSVERQSPLSLGDYLGDVAEPRTGYTRDQLGQKGFVFALTMHIQGERGSRFALRWFIVDVDREARLRGPSFNQRPAVFEPRNQDQIRTYPVWIPRPPRAGRYEVTFALVNAKGEPVAQRVTSPFRVAAPRA